MRLNKAHPDYPEFKRRWEELVQAEICDVAKEDEKRDDLRPCQDGPADAIRKKYNIMRSALQKEYGYLYE